MNPIEKPARGGYHGTGSQISLPDHHTSKQLGLYDQDQAPSRNRAPLAAKSDPITSHAAASEITSNGVREDQKRALSTWMRSNPAPATSAEMAAASGLDRHGVARRLPDLERDRLVERARIRECRIGRRPAITWRPR